MRFLADENVSRLVIDGLRREGHDVEAITEENPGAPDTQVLQVAGESGCILVTEDKDFGELVIRQRRPVRGVVLLELDRRSNAAEAQRVIEIVRRHGDKLEGQLVVLEPARTRLRPLPTAENG